MRLAVVSALVLPLLSASSAHAQATGTTQKPLPNVMLLVDTSGSMERMTDNSLPEENAANTCTPGSVSNPNRWGVLLQALTGNIQPYFSCGSMDRADNGALVNEYRIGTNKPYDKGYFLPYHRPLSGTTAANACAIGPWRLPGGGSTGVGPGNEASSEGTTADSFPSDALRNLKFADIMSSYPGAGGGSAIAVSSATSCDFLQANDGQLDAARDYVRFGLMTFDSDVSAGIGVDALSPTTTVSSAPFTGQWSFIRSEAFAYGSPGNVAMGRPAGCATNDPFEVGARHWGAPPWEGRLVDFGTGFASLDDVRTTNERIQQVLLASRPFGPTPIDALLDDARDYLWNHNRGPSKKDPYVKGGCRDQYVILLTDGAPNLNLRPVCEGPGGQCPYPASTGPTGTQQSIAWDIARNLKAGTGHFPVPVYVIGFAVNGANDGTGDGFPGSFQTPPNNNCSTWFYSSLPGGFNGSSAAMSSYCRATPPTPGTTADACCQLNEIAYFGSAGGAPPYFAESQRDLAAAFGRVLADITKTASTRTVPAYSSVATSTVDGASRDVAASFVASFVPNPRKPWSGQIDRNRSVCVAGAPTAAPFNAALGDAFDQNLARQSFDGLRRVITVKADTTTGSAVDSSRSLRPFVTSSTDGLDVYQGTEVGVLNNDAMPVAAEALSIDDGTCKRSRDLAGDIIPALNKTDCAKVAWGFTVASSTAQTFGGYNKWNVRCASMGSGNKCALNASTSCTTDADCTALTPGDVCVPECGALGAVFRSSPAAISPPMALSRDEGYRAFAEGRAGRKHALFVASTDGVLHAFKSLDEAPTTAKHELWSFIPPVVLPKVASNYPAGQQILLDGSPVVKDMVWDRGRGDLSSGKAWHTTLVAGLGTNGPGYYALNVSDVDCSSGDCTTTYDAPSKGVKAEAAFGDTFAGTVKRGPHFLWQLTDAPFAAGETLPSVRTAPGETKKFVALFGRQTGTPALTTVYIDPTGTGSPHEVGVAILPGGTDGPPTGATGCTRALDGTYSATTFPDLSDPTYARRTKVRQWGATCASPVAGRSVTIVRVDTGQILAHFARAADAPKALKDAGVVIDSPFDSPMTGLPVVYPSDVGTVAQKAYIGDADGTMWRLDLSNADPTKWKALLFQDLYSAAFGVVDMMMAEGMGGRAVAVPPMVSLDQAGNVVLNVATGEQEDLSPSTGSNMVVSVVEGRPVLSLGNIPQASVKWYTVLKKGERVTGPMALFDGTLYFATYQPEAIADVCGTQSKQYVWGVDYVTPQDPTSLGDGGRYKYPPSFTQKEDMTSTPPSVIPGVAVKQSLNCVDVGGTASTDYFGMSYAAMNSQTGTNYSLDIPVAKPATSGTRSVEMKSLALPKPRTPTIIDSWALVVD